MFGFGRGRAILVGGTVLLAGAVAASAQSFCQVRTTIPGINPYSVAVGDFNEDGILDLAVPQHSGMKTTAIMIGDGLGGFTHIGDAGGTQQGDTGAATGDFNEDGHMDVATTVNFRDELWIHLGNGNGTFVTAPSALTTARGASHLTTRDINGDNHLDLLVVGSGQASPPMVNGALQVWLGDGAGQFSLSQTLSPESGFIWYPTLCDFNNDQVLDLVLPHYSSNTCSLYLGNGTGFTEPPISVPTSGSNSMMAGCGDIDGDGNFDIAVSNYGSDDVSILLGTGLGSFEPAIHVSAEFWPQGLGAQDLNGDGLSDIVTGCKNSNTVRYYPSSGGGAFATAEAYTSDMNPWFLLTQDSSGGIIDFNGDLRPDFLVTHETGNSVEAYLNQGPVSYLDGTVNSGMGSTASILSVNGSTTAVTLATGAPLTISMAAPPAGTPDGAYVLWAWLADEPKPNTLTLGRHEIGVLAHPTPLNPLSPEQPFRAIRSNLPTVLTHGVRELPGPSSLPFLVTRGSGFSFPVKFILQGVVRDQGAGNATGLSATNAVFVCIQ